MADDFVTAAEAAEYLDVKRQTLYAYVSRGWLTSIPDPNSTRARLYSMADLKRLLARSSARAGDGPVAAAALRWGSPVLETSICEILPDGPRLRGTPLRELIDTPFENVAAAVWQHEGAWSDGTATSFTGAPLDRIRRALLDAELTDDTRDVPTAAVRAVQSRRIVWTAAGALGGGATIAECVNSGLGGDERWVETINRALVVCCEHELNASAFAARVAASTGANLYAAVSAALSAFVGPKHGGMSRRIRRLLEDVERDGAQRALLDRLSAGESLPGFGHTLYPHGDPRFEMLTRDLDAPQVVELVEAAGQLGMEPPNLDMGLVAIARAASLDEGAESAVFAVGRTVGWIAHATEQAEQGFLLRPRATFVGESNG